MGRIVAIDFGLKRTGIAVTDPLRIIATALTTVETSGLLKFLTSYCDKEAVDEFVVGMPKTMRNQDSSIAPYVRGFVEQLKKAFPEKPIHLADERFTSKMAQRSMIDSGMSKKNRRGKENVDMVSATIILQSFLSSKN